ncbi:MAG: hypothetical protein ABEH64_12395, partial [Salinirussus sp.]
PYGDSAVLGTTARPIDGPEAVARTTAEIDTLVESLAAIVPDVASTAPRRAYWGIRSQSERNDESRAATIINHENRDGVWGLVSVFGGKLTTHRSTAERVTDMVCASLGIRRACQTADLDLPVLPSTNPTGASVGADPVLCESQRVTRAELRAVLDHDVLGGDLRTATQLTRAGMGDCQGGRCAHRLAAQADQTGAVEPIDEALQLYANARWAGRRHALWGEGAAGALETYDFHTRGLNRARNQPEWDRFAGQEVANE